MLRQGAPAREFADADAMRAHYRALQARLWSPPALQPQRKECHTRSLSIAEARREREQREDEERLQAALADRARLDQLIFQVINPEQLAREPRRLIAGVAKAFGVEPEEIVGPSRTKRIVRARLAAIAAVHEAHTDWSLHRLGRCFNRDHSTILWAIRKVTAEGVPQPPSGGADA